MEKIMKELRDIVELLVIGFTNFFTLIFMLVLYTMVFVIGGAIAVITLVVFILIESIIRINELLSKK
jgi:hypothetical protein